MQYFLTALRDISPIPPLSEIVLCHNDIHLDPTSRFQDCNLPHEPTLHVRFSSHLDAHSRTESTQPEPTDTAGLPTVPTNVSLPVDKDLDTQRERQDVGKAEGGMDMAPGISPSQTFVQNLKGKTHVLPFSPQDSIAKKILHHSSQLHLPPLRELYILSGRHIIQAESTATENGLHHEPHLKILLRCRGGMRGGFKGSPQGGPGGKGRGTRSPGGEGIQMGGSHATEDSINHTTPPQRGGRGRGRGNRLTEHKGPTIVHTVVQEPVDNN